MSCVNCDCKVVENEDTGLCSSCGIANRKADRLALVEKKKPKGIKPRSHKRIAEDKVYSVVRAEYLEKHPYCEVKLLGCVGMATEIHHTDMSALERVNPNTFKASCWRCHRELETKLSAEVRREKGLLV
jgi:hypothetical protein